MITKLVIKAFKDEHLSSELRTFELQVNPEKISRSFQNEYRTVPAIHGAGLLKRFAGIGTMELKLDFVIDATGIIPGVTSVPDKLTQLRKTVSEYDGDIHSPPFLKVAWGDLDFDCRFVSMTVDYSLFSPSGIPLRAKVSAKFVRHVAADTLAKQANQKSPDLTHARLVRAGDTLTRMCMEVYRDERYYTQVARHNDLDDLVGLTPGAYVNLPPLRD